MCSRVRRAIVLIACCFPLLAVSFSLGPLLAFGALEAESRGHGVFRMVRKESLPEVASDVSELRDALKYFDANFFGDSEVQEMAEGAREFNVPIFRENRGLVASVDGGLHNPSVLVFDSSWIVKEGTHGVGKFNYPYLSGIKKPHMEDDIAFMSILELGALIRTKQITSSQLTDIFLRRLKRYNHVLQAVVTYTEELAYSQAKNADELLEQGVYLECRESKRA